MSMHPYFGQMLLLNGGIRLNLTPEVLTLFVRDSKSLESTGLR